MTECPQCVGSPGWVRERHPDKPFQHDGCTGAGVPCDAAGCPHSLFVSVTLPTPQYLPFGDEGDTPFIIEKK